MDIDEIRTFVSIAQLGGFTRAAGFVGLFYQTLYVESFGGSERRSNLRMPFDLGEFGSGLISRPRGD